MAKNVNDLRPDRFCERQHPLTILDGLLSLLDRIEPRSRTRAFPPLPDDDDEKETWARARLEDAVKHLGADLGKDGTKR